MPQTLQGTVETVTYRNEENGYTVMTLSNEDGVFTAVGALPQVTPGDRLILSGDWMTHKVYGEQFRIESFERLQPETCEEIYRYLSSRTIRGVGPVTARMIVDRFGQDTLRVIEKEPYRLAQIRGISPAKAQKISEEYKLQTGLRDVMMGLSKYGITPEQSVRIYQEFGASAVELLRQDPYAVCEARIGLSFDFAERLAACVHLPPDSDCRIRGGLRHVLRHNLMNGHTCLPREKLLQVAVRLLDCSRDEADVICQQMSDRGELSFFLQKGEEFIALPEYYQSECYIASRMELLLRFPFPPARNIRSVIERVEEEQGITYEETQKAAIEAAVNRGILVLTGGPGTGKTTTLRAIISILERNGMKLALAAPTGRAAKRMEELTGREAKTIHRLLEVEWDSHDRPVFTRNETNTLEADAIIVDELSMVDVPLFEALLRAMNLGCRLILVGDADQIPSVGAGNVIGDLIAGGRVPVIRLTEIFRQSMESLIVTNAHRIVQGLSPELGRKDADFFLLHEVAPLRAGRLVAELCSRRLPEAYEFSPLQDIQVLCPSKKFETGSAALNNLLQGVLNPPAEEKAELALSDFVLRMGDKVMQIRNNYNIPYTRPDGSMGSGVYNGDIGILTLIDRKNAQLTVQFDDRKAVYGFDDAADLELAYAVTIHKSQGSEYPCVIIPVIGVPSRLRYRNLLYTGITRAKQLLILIGTEQAVGEMVENACKTLRYTALEGLMRGEESAQ